MNDDPQEKTFRILSIDAWRNGPHWDWNNWHCVGDCPTQVADMPPRKLFRWLRDNGYLNARSIGKVELEDDQYNVVICERSTHRPLYAIEYGATVY
jgi:hypothetical protein